MATKEGIDEASLALLQTSGSRGVHVYWTVLDLKQLLKKAKYIRRTIL